MNKNSMGQKLSVIRDSLGLSLTDAAKQIGVNADTIKRFEENSATVRHSKTLRKINTFIDEHSDDVPEIWQENSSGENPDKKELQSTIFSRFIHGKRYCIFDTGNNAKADSEYFNPLTGKGCVFIYLRKEGKHHIFREERGGWTRTYTDNQLIGKKIKEA